jgi:hypothetical protein
VSRNERWLDGPARGVHRAFVSIIQSTTGNNQRKERERF